MSPDRDIWLLTFTPPLENPLTLGKLLTFSEPQISPQTKQVIVILKEKCHKLKINRCENQLTEHPTLIEMGKWQ